jgi:hypothetical protein
MRSPRGKASGGRFAAQDQCLQSAKRPAEPWTPASSGLAVDQGLREFGHDVDERYRGERLGGEGYEL